jgi:hypothetical protein
LCRVGAAGNQRAGVAHALVWRGGDASDEVCDWLLHVVLDPVSRVGFVRAADFADHDDRFGIRMVVEHAHDADVLQAVDRAATDADCRRTVSVIRRSLPGQPRTRAFLLTPDAMAD